MFTNIISEGDGTIASLEALLLNIPYRPNSFPFSQSDYAQTSFTFSPAFYIMLKDTIQALFMVEILYLERFRKICKISRL